MRQDEIIRMARESQKESFVGDTGHWFKMEVKDLERFYLLAWAAGAAHEREARAKVCETDELCCKCGDECAAAIRARGEK